MNQEQTLESIAHSLNRIADSLESISVDIEECFGCVYGKNEKTILEVIADELHNIYSAT